MNSPWLALVTLGCFCVLASYSHGYVFEKQRRLASRGHEVTLWSRVIPRMDTASEMVARAHSDIKLVETKTDCGDDFGCWVGRE